MTKVFFHEWGTFTPKSMPILAGLDLRDASVRRLADDLESSERLTVLELRDGLQVTTSSYVGTIRLGELELIIQPKIQGLPLFNLLRYAYDLRDLKIFEVLPQGVARTTFHDLLIHQLVAEVSELLARGLHRQYDRKEALLTTPRGRIDFPGLARRKVIADATLPCIHHPRQEDNEHNQAILAGLQLGMYLTSNLALRAQLRPLAARLADRVATKRLTEDLIRKVNRDSDRLTAAYRPALAIIELLLASQGTAFGASENTASVPSFLFDMNRFFQALISRFLHEHLAGYTVLDEHHLNGMMAYDNRRNPQRRRAPTPRPDFIVLQQARIIAILDTKYRDLWDNSLPREMLYQLVIYATSKASGGRAFILYPTMSPIAQDACIVVNDFISGGQRAEVILRPVDILKLEKLVTNPHTEQQSREAAVYARCLVFGATE